MFTLRLVTERRPEDFRNTTLHLGDKGVEVRENNRLTMVTTEICEICKAYGLECTFGREGMGCLVALKVTVDSSN